MPQTATTDIPESDAHTPHPPLAILVRRWWFLWPLALRLLTWLFLAQAYEASVFQDASRQMVAGQGVYARFAGWVTATGDGYFAAPPTYAYMLWVSGRLAAVFGDHWWLHQLLIKTWLLAADLAVMAYLLYRHPRAARSYWTLWFVPIVAIGQLQPDLWVGLLVLAALALARQGRWMWTGALLGVGASLKPVPLIIVPFLIIFLFRAGNRRAGAPLSIGLLAALAAGWLPYVLLFPDAREFIEVIRFHAARPVAGLTIPSGILLIVNAALTLTELHGIRALSVSGAYEAVVRAGAAYPVVTAGVFGALLAGAAAGRRWSLPQTFAFPLLAFLAANKVVHEHYILQVLPLLLVRGQDLRGLVTAFSVYLLAAGSPLRFFPAELGLPSTIDVVLPPPAGLIVSLTLAVVTGIAAVAFGMQVLSLMASFSWRAPPRSGSD
ncbi:MAG TPA: hypothetical protein VI007_01695 [bacterium]